MQCWTPFMSNSSLDLVGGDVVANVFLARVVDGVMAEIFAAEHFVVGGDERKHGVLVGRAATANQLAF